MRHRVHRAWVGATKDLERVHHASGRLRHYEADELPVAPAAATIVTRTQQNWDGGPELHERVAILEEVLTMAPERVAAVEVAIGGVSRALAVWGVGAIAICTWVTGDGRARELAAQRSGCCIGPLYDLVTEVASNHGLDSYSRFGLDARACDWAKLAQAGVVFPQELDDPYCAFGPSGPPIVPERWRGRAVRDLDNPFPAMQALAAHGLVILGLTADEVFVWPTSDPP